LPINIIKAVPVFMSYPKTNEKTHTQKKKKTITTTKKNKQRMIAKENSNTGITSSYTIIKHFKKTE